MGIPTITVTDSDRVIPFHQSKEANVLDFNYITLNGLDEETKKRMEKDVTAMGYKGSKSAYVSGLIRDGLDRRESLRVISDEKELSSLCEQISSIDDRLGQLLADECQKAPQDQVDRLLLVEVYRMLESLLNTLGIDADDIRKGRWDSLPEHLAYKENALRRAYGNVA